MKILYIANNRVPTEKAHGFQIMKTCEALALAGSSVVLVIPDRKNEITSSPFDFYNMPPTFSVKKIFSLNISGFGLVGFLFRQLSFALRTIVLKISYDDIIYSRDEFSLYFLSFFHKNIFYEVHDGRWNFFVRRVIKKSKGIVSITQGLKDFYINHNVPAKKIIVSPDGADLSEFCENYKKNECRKKLDLPQGKKIILYAGHLYDWKGVYVLADSVEFLDKEVVLVFVGGTENDVKIFKKYCKNRENILICGHKPHSEVPMYLSSADVLVIPNSARSDISKYYTSPMKLFEYMASGVPIVASDLPAIREVLNETNAVFFDPDNSKKLALSIRKLLGNDKLMDDVSKKAKNDVLKYSWDKRAESILNFIKNA